MGPPKLLLLKDVVVENGGTTIVRGVSMGIGRGEVMCVMGRNGVGKTTLAKAIVGILPVREGSIFFEGKAISAVPAEKRSRMGLAYVPQGRELFGRLTVWENLVFGCLARGHKPCPAEVERVMDLFPGVKTMVRRRAAVLSGGQQQQVAIARALMTQPKLLVLDEPTEGIQPSIVEEIKAVLLKLKEFGGIGILLIEQSVEFARQVADYIYVMDRGMVVDEGPKEEMDEERIRHNFMVWAGV